MTSKAAVWYRVSTGHQDSANQVPDVERFVSHRGYEVAETYTINDSAFKNGVGGPEYQATLKQALADAHAGKFQVLVIWSIDRICRTGPEDLLRLLREFTERRVTVVSVKEDWLQTSDPKVRDLIVGITGWVAQQESERRSERIKAGLARRTSEGKPIGRQAGATDKRERKTAGYKGNTNAKAKAVTSGEN